MIKEQSIDERAYQTPLEDLRRDALKHYDEASSAIHHWSSFVQNAIKAYTPADVYIDELKPEWQLCPKCLGDGHLGRYNTPPVATTTIPLCDVCNGSKIIMRPLAAAANMITEGFKAGVKNKNTIMVLHYFGTDTRQAGHYFWTLSGNSMNSSRIYLKDIPFSPESVPLSKTNGDVETFVLTDFKRGKFYCILAICGSPVDKRGGCKSVFWIEGGDLEKLNSLIRETPAAMEIINKMPFNVEGFKAVQPGK